MDLILRYLPTEMILRLLEDYSGPALIIPVLTACSWSSCPAMRWRNMEALKSSNGGTEAGCPRDHVKAMQAKTGAVPSTYSAVQNQLAPRNSFLSLSESLAPPNCCSV